LWPENYFEHFHFSGKVGFRVFIKVDIVRMRNMSWSIWMEILSCDKIGFFLAQIFLAKELSAGDGIY
jgi:hypothetical protein